MEFMDIPSAIDEILSIQKRCESLQKEAEEIAKRTERVSVFLCTLIGRSQEKMMTQKQYVVPKEENGVDTKWEDVLINDLKQNGKSTTSQVNDRICEKKGITDKDKKIAMKNNVRTLLGNFRDAGLIKSQSDGMKNIWYFDQ